MATLPRQFLSSLRILFDILDENRTGYVRFCDIESRWSDDGVRGLPVGVVEGLRKVTPPNGFLTFDTFVAGLKLVLTTKKKENINDDRNHEKRRSYPSKENRPNFSDIHNHRERIPYNHDDMNKGHENRPLQNQPSPTGLQNSVRPGIDRRYNDANSQIQLEGQRRSPQFQPNLNSNNGFVKTRDGNSFNNFAIKSDVSSYPNNNPARQNQYNHSTNGNHSRRSTGQPDQPPALPPRSERGKSADGSNMMKKSLSGPDLHSRSPPILPPRERHPDSRVLNDLKSWQKQWTENKQSQSGREEQAYYRKKPQGDAIYGNY